MEEETPGVCPICQESIEEDQETEHFDGQLVHKECYQDEMEEGEERLQH